MPKLSMFPTILRELTCSRTLPREPEPDLVMDGAEQVQAYADAGRIDGVMSAAYLFNSARISQVIQGCQSVLDLGCGPATQLAQVAELNPEVSFTGMDLSPEMLKQARAYVSGLGLKNVTFTEGDITRLASIEDNGFDAVISTMALHHLPSLDLLDNAFSEIMRVLKPGGAIYLVDFGRLKSLKSVIYFAYMNRNYQPHLFSLDYERSLRAAFLPEDFSVLAEKHLAAGIQVTKTAFLPVLVLVKSEDKVLPQGVLQSLKIKAAELPKKYQADLNDIRQLFGFSGLKNDPFK